MSVQDSSYTKACKDQFNCAVCAKSDYDFTEQLYEHRHHMQEYHWNRLFQPQLDQFYFKKVLLSLSIVH